MTGFRLLAAAALLLPSPALAQTAGEAAAPTLSERSEMLASALSGQTITLTMRGATVSVMATAVADEGGCAARVTAHGHDARRKWTRLFRWDDIAWAGTDADGGTMMSFHHHEGRLATDMVRFRPADPAGFRAALDAVTRACRSARGSAERILNGGDAAERSCYFPRLPGLQIFEAATFGGAAAGPPRAVLRVLARENPDAELQLLFERTTPDASSDAMDRGVPDIAFTYGDPHLKGLHIAQASFALDDKPMTLDHSIALYGDTRVRIRMAPGSFHPLLAGSQEARLTLHDRASHPKAVLHFATGPVLAAALAAIEAAEWSCEGAAPALKPASDWHRAD